MFSIGSQGMLFPNVSNGIVTDPGKGVGEGISVAAVVGIAVGASVSVGGTGGGVEVGAGPHPLRKIRRVARAREIGAFVFFMADLHFMQTDKGG